MSSLIGLLRKEVYHILRDRRTLAVLILLPVVQVILFGYSIRTDVKDVLLAVVDPSPDATTLAIRDRFNAAGTFRTVAVVASDAALEPLFRSNRVQVAIEFAPQFAERARSVDGAEILVVTDATEPNTGTARLTYVNAVIQQYLASSRLSAGGVRIEPQVRSRFNPTRESANLFVPGLMAMVLTIISALMTALSLTREKETGTMEALLVSPLRPWQIVIGKVAPYLVIGFVSVAAVLIEARLVFHVPIEGSLPLLLAEGLLFILVALSIGILVSARTSSQRVAMLATMMATMLPTQMLSGFIFPIESMPRPLQWVSNIVPAKWFVLIARGIMLKGVGLTYLWRETIILAAMAALLLIASARSFHTRLD
ncbi:MAG TPA: ABC transporter permease [Gemmatimonadaceae bacterium]|jgi:ABC-2 type transport system permease protein